MTTPTPWWSAIPCAQLPTPTASRARKLAYLVDSTAAPIACIALVTTWIGYQVGLIRSALDDMAALDLNAYFVFLNAHSLQFLSAVRAGIRRDGGLDRTRLRSDADG